MPEGEDPAAAVEAAYRREWAAVLAATARLTRDLDLAEECTQDAFERALERWPRDGVPDRPGAWLTTVAGNRARDLLRRSATWRRMLPELVVEDAAPGPDPDWDDRLRLILTCCHPALGRDAQVALTLRLVCGVPTPDVAHALLVRESAMAARITRAKHKIAAARIPYRIPDDDQLAPRLEAVCDVLHLVFTTGHTAPTGADLDRPDLVALAITQARMLHSLMPHDPQVSGLLALMLLTEARRPGRAGLDGALVLLADADRSGWDAAAAAEGAALVARSLRAGTTRYGVLAAIAAVHTEAPTWEATDWAEIVGLYDVLLRLWPSPVVELNRAAAVGFRDGPAAGLAALDPLLDRPELAGYRYLPATRADLLRRLGRRAEAAQCYREAIALTDNVVERAHLEARLRDVTP